MSRIRHDRPQQPNDDDAGNLHGRNLPGGQQPARDTYAPITDRSFFDRRADVVAQDLLRRGARIVRESGGHRSVFKLTAVDAYIGGEDEDTHAYKQPKGKHVEHQAGSLYVYPMQGSHIASIATRPINEGGAVTIFAVKLDEKTPRRVVEILEELRGKPATDRDFSVGRGNVAKLIGLGELNGHDLTRQQDVWIEVSADKQDRQVTQTSRGKNHKSPDLPLRFVLTERKPTETK